VGSQLNAVVADTPNLQAPATPLALGAPAVGKQLTDARELAKQNPAAVAHIVRGWVGTETS
jgi:flagellar M-ring protein FliF